LAGLGVSTVGLLFAAELIEDVFGTRAAPRLTVPRGKW
jgi:hypothetical protein